MCFPGLRAFLSALILALVASPVVVPGPRVAGTASSPRSAVTTPDLAVDAPFNARPKADPRTKRGLFVDDRMKAANAGDAFKAIGRRAQPLWITDYYASPSAAREATKAYISRARSARKTPLLVVYNIPDRDCGLYSSQDDQITDKFYKRWVAQVANGMRGGKAIVVLEPDAIPFIDNPDCTGRGDRLGLLRFATKKLTQAGAWVYIDAGHSGWRSSTHMAPLLKKAGIKQARGFATNVANSRTNKNEAAYARSLIKQLKKRKIKGVRYIVDTSRNGAGKKGPANGDVCNPLAARIGADPRLIFKGAFDGRLWVKLPGESDGPCNGGPGSGEFFPTGACRLLKGADFYYDGSVCRK
ncbi:glycoside hydrolase family 6 protein [Nocardioides sp.]|uniref:glycoside hydrolase family 6 protein n=1 Tax=Nocardioides sp. TaxID=35761 RepID=UPI00321AE7A5